MSSYLLGFISTQEKVLYSNRLQQTEAITLSLFASSGKCGLASEISFNKRHSSLLCFVLFSPLTNINSLPVTRVKEKMWAEGMAALRAFHQRDIKALGSSAWRELQELILTAGGALREALLPR